MTSMTGFFGRVTARPARDRRFCEAMLPKVSRTFALSISRLPAPLRESVGTAYLLCRIVDSIEDDATLRHAEREELFELFDALMSDDRLPEEELERRCTRLGVGDTRDERELCRGAGAVLRSFRRLSLGEREAIRPHVLEMSRGMREYCERSLPSGTLQLSDIPDLERYCYFVAGTVGKLLTELFALHVGARPDACEHAVSFGIGLQLVNIVKDVAADLERGVCYLPRQVLDRNEVGVSDLLDPARRNDALAAVEAVCRLAEEHLGRAARYTLAWPATAGRDVRLFCTVPLALALATLGEVREGTDTLVRGRTPKVSRLAVATIIREAQAGADADDALEKLFARLAPRPRAATPAAETTVARVDLERALVRARAFLGAAQAAEGYWKGELATNVSMDAEDLLLRQFFGIRTPEVTRLAAEWIRSQQRDDGTWANARGAPAELSTTVESYVALKLAGDPIDAPHMQRAAEFIRKEGGVPATRVFTRMWLALFGLWPWRELPVLPPEMMLLPPWVPLNVYDFACWARQTIVALTIVMTEQPVRPIGFDLSELDVPARPDLKKPANGWGRVFEAIDRALRAYAKRPVRALRELSLAKAEAWIVRRQEADGSWGGIQPPWVYSMIALHLRGYALDHPAMKAGLAGLDRFTVFENGVRRLEACQSPVWDTALAVLALSDAGEPADSPAMVRGADWLLANEVRVRGDWSVKRPELAPSGWAFEFANVNYPDIDDTTEVLLALRRISHPKPQEMESSIARGIRWVLGMQCKDGGWAAFDVDNTRAICREIPFCDFGEVIDPPSADVTAHAVEVLSREGLVDHPATQAGIRWLFANQEADGSWFGRWGVNHVYGTGAVLMALDEAGVSHEHAAVKHAVDWLVAHQNADGGWGEDVRSYDDPAYRGVGTSTPSQTAWALLGLFAARVEHEAVERGIAHLVATQREDGIWNETRFTGTGFPGDFYIDYHLYRQVFPTMALGRYARRLGVVTETRRTASSPVRPDVTTDRLARGSDAP